VLQHGADHGAVAVVDFAGFEGGADGRISSPVISTWMPPGASHADSRCHVSPTVVPSEDEQSGETALAARDGSAVPVARREHVLAAVR